MKQIDTIANDAKRGNLTLTWAGGEQQQLSSAFLRSQCQCAECKAGRLRGHSAPELPSSLRITGIKPVGSYGVQLIFSDGHDRGIYPWVYLHALGQAANNTSSGISC